MKFIWSLILLTLVIAAKAQDDDYVSLQDRLKSNIFLKVDASATDCYVGEPIIVTYKLYSAMASESNIARNPVFDGFNVRDLKGSDDEIASRETVDGVAFDVHTILRLQLTPYKAGRLSIGSLVVRNRVKLVDANGNKDPILDDVTEGYTLNNGYFTLNVTSVPLTVSVTGLPNTSNTSNFDGLVGDFKMNVQIPKTIYAPGEQGILSVTIIGTGDFTKIKQPEIEWPAGVEVLPAKIDNDKDLKTNGSSYKSFQIPFKATKQGKYTIPSINFSFFDAITGKYKTITNIPLTFNVVKETTSGSSPGNNDNTNENGNTDGDNLDILLIGIATIVILLALVMIINRSKKKRHHPQPVKERKKNIKNEPVPAHFTSAPDIDELLRPAADSIHHTGNSFYSALKQALANYFENRFALPTTLFNKDSLKLSMADNDIPVEKQKVIMNVLTDIDMNIYSGGGLDVDRQSLLARARQALQQL